MTVGKETYRRTRVGQALAYAGIGPEEDPADVRVRKRAEITARWLPEIVDEVLASDEIARGVAQAGLNSKVLRQQVLDHRPEILAPADDELADAIDAVLRVPGVGAFRPNRVIGITTALVGIATIAVTAALLPVYWDDGTSPWLLLSTDAFLLVVAVAFIARGTTMYRRATPRSAASAELALQRWARACLEEGVLPYVRHVVDEHLAPFARLVLGVTTEDAPGLRGTSEWSYVVRTSSVEAFLTATERLPTGAIGLAGPRGVGKTSLIEYFAGREGVDRAMRVTVSAPVQYEPRDFVLHLFASVCQAVLRERPPGRRRSTSWVTVPIAVLSWFVVTVAGELIGNQAAAFPLATYLWLTAGVVAAVLLFWFGDRLRRRFVGGPDPVRDAARRHLDNIRYLRTHTSGWSGKLTLPLKAEAGWSRQTQRERRPQTYPELVDALREFLGAYAQAEGGTPAVIIAIDELDKIESADRAQQFLNEIKGIFGAPGTQFLVAVSEDALASFERRGLPVRDAFDSAFHEIVRVDYLTLTDTANLLSSRVLRLPEPFKWLVHCMSGGLPRDVVRTARAMVALTSEPAPGLDEVCAALVAEDLRRKSHAFQLACRDIGDSPDVTEFIRSLRRLPGDAAHLLGLVPVLRRDGELATLSRQAAAYVYYSATLLQVFTRDRVDSRDNGTFDLLARAKQALAVHPRLAWLQVDEFREAWQLPTVPVD